MDTWSHIQLQGLYKGPGGKSGFTYMNPDENDSNYFNKLTLLERKILEFRAINLPLQTEPEGGGLAH